jgi:hypothetical protein
MLYNASMTGTLASSAAPKVTDSKGAACPAGGADASCGGERSSATADGGAAGTQAAEGTARMLREAAQDPLETPERLREAVFRALI